MTDAIREALEAAVCDAIPALRSIAGDRSVDPEVRLEAAQSLMAFAAEFGVVAKRAARGRKAGREET
jgi:hypothetical protein